MPDPLTPPDPGAFSSVLDTLRLGGFGVRNLLKGNLEGAGRNVLDILGRTADAALPGDWIPDVSRPEDRPEFRDVVNVGGDGLLSDALNFAGDVITDPVSYIPGAAIAKGLGAVGKGVQKGVGLLPEAISKPLTQGAKQAAKTTIATFGAQRVSPETAKAIAAKAAASDLVSRAGQEGAVDALAGLTDAERLAYGQAALNMRLDPLTGKPVAVIDETGLMSREERLRKMFGEDRALRPEALLEANKKISAQLQGAWERGQGSGPGGNVFFEREVPLGDGVSMASPGTAGVADYFPLQFKGLRADEIDELTGLPKSITTPNLAGLPSPIKSRADWTPQQQLEWLAKNPEVSLEMDPAKVLPQYYSQLGELSGRGKIGQDLFDRVNSGQLPLPPALAEKYKAKVPGMASSSAERGLAPVGATPMERIALNDFKYADPEMRSAAQEIARQLPDEEATVVLNALNGLAPRGAFTGALAKLNVPFKKFAVYGAIIPKLGAITRNLTGGLWQQFSNAEARGDLPRAAMQLIPNWLKSIDDGVEKLFGKRIGTNEFAEVDNAFKMAGGDPRKVLDAIKNPTMREAVEKGVLGNNFVDTEQLISSAAKGGWKAFGKNLMDYPGAMFKGAEQRMRYGLFSSLRAQGKSADEAAKIVQDTFYDYSISGLENRTARDFLPFFQFTAKAIPQQAKLLQEKPIVASAIANLSGGAQGDPLLPSMEGNINIPIGRDEQGNKQYISNTGLPIEALNFIPNPSADLAQFGRQVEQRIVGSSQPMLKTAFATVAGEDPYFGTPFGSYSKVAGTDLGRPGAAINQLLGTGLPGAAPISGLLGMGSKATDDRTSALEKATNLLTGIRVQSVDPDVAIRQRLTNLLEQRPDIPQFKQAYNPTGDEDVEAILQGIKDARKRLKEKAKTAANPY